MLSNNTNKAKTLLNKYIPYILFIAAFIYTLFYFDYFQTPPVDFIAQLRRMAVQYASGDFPGESIKMLPTYPLVLVALVKLFSIQSFDPYYTAAQILNIVLYVPFFVLSFKIFSLFISRKKALFAQFFLAINIYTVFLGVNCELEMLQAVTGLFALYMVFRGNKLSYLSAFVCAALKWDSVFIVPAVMYNDFFKKKKYFQTIIFGGLASLGAISWLLLSFFKGNQYVDEISQRGPNGIRYFYDIFAAMSSFPQWVASKLITTDHVQAKLILSLIFLLSVIIFITSFFAGIWVFLRKKFNELIPILIYVAGFTLVHMVHAMSKPRYTLAILWFIHLITMYGFFDFTGPMLKKLFGQLTKNRITFGVSATVLTLISICGLAPLLSIGLKFLLIAILFIIIFSLLLYLSDFNIRENILFTILLSLVIQNYIYFGHNTMDHYSLRRVEFKLAGLWYKDNIVEGKKMLIANTSFPIYYTDLPSSVFATRNSIESSSYDELLEELKEKNILYVYVDDFYISRYAYGDKNATDKGKNTWVFIEILQHGKKGKDFTLVKTIEPTENIKGYIFKLPED